MKHNLFLAGSESRAEYIMNLFLAGSESRAEYIMNLFLAGQAPWAEQGIYDKTLQDYKPMILDSFFYITEHAIKNFPNYSDFLLDSGAFTFMMGKGSTNFDSYLEKYAEFINKYDIEKFFELDVDSVIGYENVLKLRERLVELTGKNPIPVWHKSRGIDDFKEMCEKYDYVAIGGIVSGEITLDEYNKLPFLINEAHKRGSKIHGLGFTSLKYLPICHFDSVDSTAWTTGNRFGYVYKFNGKTMSKIDPPKGYKLGDTKKVAQINFSEWCKFQKYAKTHL